MRSRRRTDGQHPKAREQRLQHSVRPATTFLLNCGNSVKRAPSLVALQKTVSGNGISEIAIQRIRPINSTGGERNRPYIILVVHLRLGLVRITRSGGASRLHCTDQNHAHHYRDKTGTRNCRRVRTYARGIPACCCRSPSSWCTRP